MATKLDLLNVPYKVAEDTFVIPWLLEAPPIGYFPMNSMVIRGREPIIVDTGSPANREEWLRNAWSIVEPEDVRWIFLTHDDRDHSGNLLAILDACPNATLLTTWFMVGRMFEEWATPLDRCRFLNDGESLDVGDRRLVAVRPPLFDNPTTRGLFDEQTGVYWSVDTFATNAPHAVQNATELDSGFFREGQLLGARLVSPWHQWLDNSKFQARVDVVQSLPIQVVAACHGPALQGAKIEEAFELLRQVPELEPWPEFTQHDLEQWMAAMQG
jgi:flavorubredoxin